MPHRAGCANQRTIYADPFRESVIPQGSLCRYACTGRDVCDMTDLLFAWGVSDSFVRALERATTRF